MITFMMPFMRRKSETGRSGRLPARRAISCAMAVVLTAVIPLVAPAWGQLPPRPSLEITGYLIKAELDPSTHHLSATTTVTFTAPANLDVVTDRKSVV